MKKTNIFGLVLILSTLLIGCAQPNTSADIPEVYTITCATNNSSWGGVTCDKTSAAAGETVTITATPASAWYVLKDIKVNNELINGTSFTMPEGNVTVAVTFEEKVFGTERLSIPVNFYDNSVNINSSLNTSDGMDEYEIRVGGQLTWGNVSEISSFCKKSDFSGLKLLKSGDTYTINNTGALSLTRIEKNETCIEIYFGELD